MSSFIHERLRLIFVHVPKTGGQTVSKFFGGGKKRVWRNTFSTLNEGIATHAGMPEITARLGPQAADYFSFAFYRNTWDWAFSYYRYMRATKHHPEHQTASTMSFEDWVMNAAAGYYRPQAALVTQDGRRTVSRLEDFTNFHEALTDILQELGYEAPQFAAHNVAPQKVDYREVYTPQMMRKIGDIYADDIDFFGFRF